MLPASSNLIDFSNPSAAEPRTDLRRVGINPDYWYPLAWSKHLKPGKTLGVSFAGDPIVLVRTTKGTLFALEDRCAHRQVPLRAGLVDGECIRCCYHGWAYDSSGRCSEVPYLGNGEKRPNGVRAYPCREAYGMVFVFPGAPDKCGATPFPCVSRFADSNYVAHRLDQLIACHYSFMHENLMDMNHQFLHRRLMGLVRPRLIEMRYQTDSLHIDYRFSRPGRQSMGERLLVGAIRPGKRANDHLMTISTEYPYQRLRYWNSVDEAPVLDLWIVYVPLDRRQRTNHTFGLMMIRKPRVPILIHLFWPFITWFTASIMAEDRWIVEQEQEAYDRQGGDWNNEVVPAIRRLKELLIQNGESRVSNGK